MQPALPLLRLWRYAGRHRPRIVWATTFSILNKLFDLAPPLLIGIAVDVVVERQESILSRIFDINAPISQLWVLAGLTLFVWGMESLTEYIAQLQWRNLAQSLQHDLRLETYDHVQHLELAYFEDRSTGGLMAILNDDVNQLERFLDVGAADIIMMITTMTALAFFFFATAPEVAWMAFLPIPVIIWGSLIFQGLMAPKYRAVRDQVGLLNGQLGNNLAGIATIKSFTAENIEVERIRRESNTYREHNRRAIVLSSAFIPLIRIVIVLGFAATLVYGGIRTLEGTMLVGIYSTLVFMTQRLLWPLTNLGRTFDLYQRAMASTRRIFELLDTPRGMDDGIKSLALNKVRGDLRLDKVSFQYSQGTPVLNSLNLDFPAGHNCAIVGATGAGKSTVIKLLLRFYDTTQGTITIDGHNLRDLRMRDIRRAIGLVSQDVFLFHGTVRENIAYGQPGASDAAIQSAAEVAEAHMFISELPQDYATVIGERGQKLSGGQRQRLSIARAVLKDPPILILDEATSSVDNETEAAIQRSIERLAVGRTNVVIAHRLSTVRNADLIYVLEQGKLVESGKHEELLEYGGAYAALWRVQTGERTR